MSPFLTLSICLVIVFLFPTLSLLQLFLHHYLQNFFCHKYQFLLVTGSHHLGIIFSSTIGIQFSVLVYFIHQYTSLLQFQMLHKGEKCKLNYTPEDLKQAIKKVRTGRLTYRAAFDIYGVPKSTLSYQINKHSLKDQPNKSGPECYVSNKIEGHIYW